MLSCLLAESPRPSLHPWPQVLSCLLAEGDKMASSALSRSPLMTNARLDVGGGSQKSPYAQPSRLPIADPMTSRGGGGDALKERLVGKN